MPEKTERALKKAWRGLREDEREHLKIRLEGLGVTGLISALGIGTSVLVPAMTSGSMFLVAGAGLILTFMEASEQPETRKIAKKFAKLFKIHRGKSLRHDVKRLQEKKILKKKLRDVI